MDPGDQTNTLDDFLTWKVEALRDYLTKRGLTRDGTKREMAALCFAAHTMQMPVVPTASEILRQNQTDYQRLLHTDEGIIPDPLSLYSGWLDEKNGVRKWPPIYISDIVSYMVSKDSKSTIHTYLNEYKIGKAYEYFHAGFLKEVFYHDITGNSKLCILRAKCTPTQKLNDACHDVWVCSVKKTGEVKSAYCTCTAGLGCTCNHVAGLLFRIESANKLGITSSTSLPCTWNIPSATTKLEPAKLKENTIRKSRHGKAANRRPLAEDVKVFHPVASINSQEMLETISSALKDILPNACIYKGIESSESLTSKTAEGSDNDISVYSMPSLVSKFTDSNDLMSNLPTYTKQEVDDIAKTTKGQWLNGKWHALREDRITSSKFYSIHTKVASSKTKENVDFTSITANVMGYVSPDPNLRPLKHGRETEPEAKLAYTNEMAKSSHKDVEISECGIFLDKKHIYLGSSPDLLVSCQCCGKGVVEIKCSMVKKCEKCRGFCNCLLPSYLHKSDNGVISLKKNHAYYAQVQGQLALTERDYCDFYSYTVNGSFKQRIQFDPVYYAEILQSLNHFFTNYIAPELFSREIKTKLEKDSNCSSSASSDMIRNENVEHMDAETTFFCPVCRDIVKDSDITNFRDQSICCDSCSLWFHFKCVRITKLSASKILKWVCKRCKPEL